MPIIKGSGKEKLKANFHELRGGKTYARTARKFGRRRAQKQMVAISLGAQRKRGGKRRGSKR